MSITGAADADGGGPTKVGVAIADVATGLHAAVGILAALAGRERTARRRTGSASGSTSRSSSRRWRSSSTRPRTRSSTAPPRAGSATPTRTSSRTRRSTRPTARSRSRSAASGSGRGFCLALGLPALADDPRFATNGDRVDEPRRADRDAARAARASGTSAEWLAALDAADVPAGPINDIPAAFASEQARRPRDGGRGRPPGPRADDAGRAAVRAVGDAGRDPDRRRRCSASTPTRSSPSSATPRRRSTGLRAAGGDLRPAQSSWRRNESHDRPAIDARSGRRSRRPGRRRRPAATRARVPAPAPRGRPAGTARSTGTTLSIPMTMNAATPMPAAASADRVSVLPRNVIAAKTIEREPLQQRRGREPADGECLEQDQRVEPRRGRGEERRDRERPADRDELREQERAPRRRLGQDQAGRPALLLGRDGAHRQQDRDEDPELADVLDQLVDRVGGRRRRQDDLELRRRRAPRAAPA